jgi:hypothetical protein
VTAPQNKAFKLTRSRKAWRHFVPPRLGRPSQLNAMLSGPVGTFVERAAAFATDDCAIDGQSCTSPAVVACALATAS